MDASWVVAQPWFRFVFATRFHRWIAGRSGHRFATSVPIPGVFSMRPVSQMHPEESGSLKGFIAAKDCSGAYCGAVPRVGDPRCLDVFGHV